MSLADGFEFPAPEIELWLPLRFDPAAPAVSNFSMRAVARLAPGSTAVDAKRELDTLLLRLPETYSDELVNAQMMRDAEMTTTVRPLKADIVGDVGSVLWILLGAVGFVLLVACANVANLFLVRAESREREIAVRCALGAGRAGLTRLFLADGLVVAAIGGVAGLAVAWLAVRALTSTNAVAIPRIEEVGIDAAMIVFCGGVSLLAAIVCAAYPMWRYSGRHAYAGLRGGRGDTATRKRLYARNALVVAQVAMALMLLVGSGLMARSFWGLATVDPGFVDDNVLTMREMISGVDATLPLTSIQPLEVVVSASVSRISFAMAVLAIAAAMTLLLGAIGLHGVVSYVVGQRTREIGVRMALGARGGEVARMVVQQDLLLTVAGVAIGLLGAAVLTRFLGALLYEVSPLDPVAFVVTSLTLLGVSFLASYLPARRASSVDPAIALRAE